MFNALSGATALYPIIGDPIGFVKSPQQLTARFAEYGHNGICVPMQVPQGALAEFIKGISPVPNVRGLLITMPHKNAAYACCATASATSRLLCVVSVARRNDDGAWHGDMLDGASFVAAQKKQGAILEDARVLQIGAGGVGSAIAIALLDAGARELIIHDTNQARCTELVALLGRHGKGVATAGAGAPALAGCDVIVNATPLGMSPGDPLPVPVDCLSSSMFVGDVVAGHGVTPLIQAARAAGCQTADGAQMVAAVMDIMPNFLLGR